MRYLKRKAPVCRGLNQNQRFEKLLSCRKNLYKDEALLPDNCYTIWEMSYMIHTFLILYSPELIYYLLFPNVE